MAMRIDETISGVKADLAIKIFGDDFRTLDALGQQVLRAVVGGARRGRRADGDHVRRRGAVGARGPRRARPLRPERHAMSRRPWRAAVRAIVISEVIDGQKRYTVALRLPERYRTDPDAMREDPAARAGRRTGHAGPGGATSR